MIDHPAISQGDALRAEIAAKVAAWEAENGPVVTQPIRIGDKPVPYRIACPEKKAAKERAARNATRATGLAVRRTRAANVQKVRTVMGKGLTPIEMATVVGLSPATVRSIMRELGEPPKSMRGTRQARDRAVLREVWP